MGVSPWLGFIVLCAALQYQFKPLTTDFNHTVKGLETRTIYARQKAGTICPADVVTFTAGAKETRYIRRVTASEGQVFSLTASGYMIDGKPFAADSGWVEAARPQFGNRSSLTVPKRHYLVVNSEFGRKEGKNAWAFYLVPRAHIENQITYVLFSRDFSQIGHRLGAGRPGC